MKVAAPARFRGEWTSHLPTNVQVVWYDDTEDAVAAVRDAEIAWVSFGDRAAILHLMAAGPALRWLFTQAAGIESFPIDELNRRGIRLTNGAGISAIPVAEFAILGMLALAKNFAAYLRAQDRHEWLTVPPGFVELAGSRALVVGFGGVGRAVASRLRTLEVSVVGVRRNPAGEAEVIGPDAWHDRLADFDWIILSAPLTGETRFLIDRAELARMKPTARVVNLGRGGLINEEALIDALESGWIAGAYLDVTDPEPVPPSSRIWRAPHTIVTAHLSGSATTRLWSSAPRRPWLATSKHLPRLARKSPSRTVPPAASPSAYSNRRRPFMKTQARVPPAALLPARR